MAHSLSDKSTWGPRSSTDETCHHCHARTAWGSLRLCAGCTHLFPRDRFGQVIRPGLTITYPGRQGSNMYMQDGVVETVYQESYYGKEQHALGLVLASGRHTRISNLQWVTVLPHATILADGERTVVRG